jgi:hypothetical protein
MNLLHQRVDYNHKLWNTVLEFWVQFRNYKVDLK